MPAQTAVTCPWCGKYFPSRPERGHCDDCGGPLPAPSGTERGSSPPSAPRTLPAAYRRGVMFSRNVLSILGAVFLGVGAPALLAALILLVAAGAGVLVLVFGSIGVVFAGIGAPMLFAGLSHGRKQLAALELGTAAEGELVSVQQNLQIAINRRHPWAIEYTFKAAGGQVRGVAQSWSISDGERKPGDHVWVVYLPADPESNTLWPPVSQKKNVR